MNKTHLEKLRSQLINGLLDEIDEMIDLSHPMAGMMVLSLIANWIKAHKEAGYHKTLDLTKETVEEEINNIALYAKEKILE